jgi:hypothetical protein
LTLGRDTIGTRQAGEKREFFPHRKREKTMPDPSQEQEHREEAARLTELPKADRARPIAVLSQTGKGKRSR